MSNKDNGGSAFPINPPLDNDGRSASGYPEPEAGMSLRDYFAAKAMQGLIAQSCGTAGGSDVAHGARYAYEMADAMLEARKS